MADARCGIQYAVGRCGVPAPVSFRRWIQTSLGMLERTGALTLRVTDEAESAALNQAYRNKSGPTNVLSFPFDPPPGWSGNYLGDLVLCAPVVVREAQAQGKPPRAHWAHLSVHGSLHLLGYDHQDAADARRMEALEIRILRELGFDDPYQDFDEPGGNPLLTHDEPQDVHVFQR
ncbi:MAG TPA: rRNA maturation RNase YbeY [Candidatus Macondimonas sp.]|nr:rRNA maturation RNase YbeY [Candidatus Macondimonas sp.]